MEREELRILLEKVESGQQTAAGCTFGYQPAAGYARRQLCGYRPAPTYAAGDAGGHLRGREDGRADRGDCVSYEEQKGLKNILITRLSEEKADEIAKALEFSYYSTPQIGIVNEAKTEKRGKIVVVAAGTSDLPVSGGGSDDGGAVR